MILSFISVDTELRLLALFPNITAQAAGE